jgi:hypothetical protein
VKRLAATILAGAFLFAGYAVSAETGVVKGSYINVRKEAKFDSPIITKKMRGDRYEIEFTDKYWVKVRFNDGTLGWIYKTLIERVGDAPEPEPEPEKESVKKPEKKKEPQKAKKPEPEKKKTAKKDKTKKTVKQKPPTKKVESEPGQA